MTLAWKKPCPCGCRKFMVPPLIGCQCGTLTGPEADELIRRWNAFELVKVEEASPMEYVELWLWWPGMSKPVAGKLVPSQPRAAFLTDIHGIVTDRVTHWAYVQKPELPSCDASSS